MKIIQFSVIQNVLTEHYFNTYIEDGITKESWTKLITFANKYHTIGSLNYDIKKHQIFLKDTFLEIKEIKIIDS